MQINRNYITDAADNSVTAAENSAIKRATPDRDDPLRFRGCFVSPL